MTTEVPSVIPNGARVCVLSGGKNERGMIGYVSGTNVVPVYRADVDPPLRWYLVTSTYGTNGFESWCEVREGDLAVIQLPRN